MKRHEDRIFYPVVGLAALLVAVVLYFGIRQIFVSQPAGPLLPAPEKKIKYAPPDGIAPSYLPRLTPVRKRDEDSKRRRTSVPPPP